MNYEIMNYEIFIKEIIIIVAFQSKICVARINGRI